MFVSELIHKGCLDCQVGSFLNLLDRSVDAYKLYSYWYLLVLFEVQHLSVLVNTMDSEILISVSKYVLCIIFEYVYMHKIILGLP